MNKEQLNSMCTNCLCLGKECAGTCNQVWTGCIYKKTKQEGKEHGTDYRISGKNE